MNRRDFLKLAGLLPLSLAVPRSMGESLKTRLTAGQTRNVIVLVFDALSAMNIGMYGYGRETMPNLKRLAQGAVVYHNHFSGANFTTPGTASLLTGTLPWTHRAMQHNGRVIDLFVDRNLFSLFADHHRLAYTHNPWANTLLDQMHGEIDELIPWDRLFLTSDSRVIHQLFKSDEDIATVSWARDAKLGEAGFSYSLFWSHLYGALQEARIADLKPEFPRGLPGVEPDLFFKLEDAIDWLVKVLPQTKQPFFGYFHFLPPHAPYNTSVDFYNHFQKDGFNPINKPEDVFTQKVQPQTMLRKRIEYDEFILYADREFGRLFRALETAGILDNSWLVVTSDHGEMFERGFVGHDNPTLYQPLMKLPLIIFEPGRTSGYEVHDVTSSVDVLPTLAYVTGHPIPEWTDGIVMPPYGLHPPVTERSVFAVQANKTFPGKPMTRASTMLVRGRYKLVYFFGYRERHIEELVRLYDLEGDPEELSDLTGTKTAIVADMLEELKVRIREADQPYQ